MLVLLLTIVGCARGFDRGALRDQLTHEGPAQISDADIQRALELRPQLTFPFRLAVYLQRDQVERRSYNDNVHNGSWRWEGGDKDSILATEKLRSEGGCFGYVPHSASKGQKERFGQAYDWQRPSTENGGGSMACTWHTYGCLVCLDGAMGM